MTQPIIFVFGAVFFLACSVTFSPPSQNPVNFTYDIAGSRESLFDTTAAVVGAMGMDFQIKDPIDGKLVTAAQEMRFRLEECDCGSRHGKPLLVDPLVTVQASFLFDISHGVIKLSSKVRGKRTKKNGIVEKEFDCVSTGKYERTIMDRIARRMTRK